MTLKNSSGAAEEEIAQIEGRVRNQLAHTRLLTMHSVDREGQLSNAKSKLAQQKAQKASKQREATVN